MFTSKANVEDFIWAIRQRHENKRVEELRARATIYEDRKKSIDSSSFWEAKTKILASLLPDEVLQNVNDYSHKHYNACLLLGDVSGFTELTEKYNQAGKGGPSRLTLVLNGYIGALVQEIMSFGGDIFKFSGDAFLALWKCKDEQQIMRDYVHQALDCAVVIQKNYGSFRTDIGTYLRVKLAISAGPVLFTLIGNEKYSHYIVIGKPVADVKDAEHRTKPGEIIVAPSAWYHVNTTDYLSIELEGAFRKVLGVGPGWRHIKGDNKYSLSSQQFDEDFSDDLQVSALDSEELFVQKKNMEFSLRPVMHQIRISRDSLRKFILPPVMSCIDRNEPIEYLTEMRRAVIMFINLTSKRCSYDQLAILVNECYIEICKNVEKFKGCVNKVCLFDKDIMFVVIFGLRGFKHDLECQYALKCASVTFEFLNNHKSVKTASIACTTGKTYCGIVGHTLRREYTVMSLMVNKAARIMVNYPDRVACDSSTFQHSKLEAKYFLLQVYKPLKGISNPGPIYEYLESDTKTAEQASVAVNFYPILGRDEEVNMYLSNMQIFIVNARNITDKLPTYKRMMVIRGWPRQGKTRLLEEFLFQSDPGIPVTRLLLDENDYKVDYSTVRSILYSMLGFNNLTPLEDIKEKLMNLVGSYNKEHLSCLNDILKVDFEVSEEFASMSNKDREISRGKMLKNLCYACLPSVWIVAVDKSKHIDVLSWKVLPAMLACRYIFFVITQDAFFVPGLWVRRVLAHKNVQVLQLNNIPKLYHAGMACQILNVHAISADLENLLQTKSNGNPGWMETVLISLKQSHNVFIRNADFRTINEYGLVAPPLYMMRRMSQECKMKWKGVMEETTTKNDKIIDRWGIFIDTCRDEFLDIVVREKIHQVFSEDRFLPVCFLNPKCELNNIDAELSKEGHLIMTFDSLTYQEQLLLKFSSVLGDSFTRSLLMYVMQTDGTARETAEVVKILFEKRVLCCAKGDFSEGGNYLLIRDKMLDPSKDHKIKCYCVGIYICDDVKDLPKYASCGYIRFISSRFRQTTYNLLTDAQKKMFHARAVKYLLRETKKCTSCGGAFFDLAGYCLVEEVKQKHSMRKSVSSLDISENSISLYGGSMFSGYTERSEHTTISSYGKRSNMLGRSFGFRSMGMGPSMGTSLGHALAPSLEESEEGSFYAQYFGILNPFKVLQYKDNYSLTKPFTRADFQTCYCHLILTFFYNQLVRHYRGAGQWKEMIDSMIEYSKICVVERNFAEGLNCVRSALDFLATSGENIGEPNWRIPVYEGKLYIWYGAILLSQDQKGEALKTLYLSMTKFGYPFPKSKISLHLRLWLKKLKQRLRMYLFPDNFVMRGLSKQDNDVVDSISCCLNKMFGIFLQQRNLKKAELTAVWSLTRALEAGKNLFQVCGAFSNMILIANYKKNKFWGVVLEVHALRFCHKKKYGIDPPELKAIIKLYNIIFETRLARAEYDESLQIGYILSRLTIAVNDIPATIRVFSRIMLMLLVKLYLSECITIMQELSYHITETDDPEGRSEYYASALLFHIETGYNFIPFRDVEKYYKGEFILTSRISQRKFLILLRAWFCRTNQWERAKIASKQLMLVNPTRDLTELTIHMSSCLQMLYEVEYELMKLVYMINKRNIYGQTKTKEKIAYYWKYLEERMDVVPLVKPRMYLLKSYEAVIYNNEHRMNRCVRKGRKFAVKQENMLMKKSIDFLEAFWQEKVSDEDAELWMKHSEPDNYMEYNQLNHADNIMCFPFEPPMFY
ncbi:adenylate cyclase type 10-like isoform X2 [Coccinella septempunctata]|uniref:adenylate cyclase type 10-like isoform X2 n=1 Tax=Coccinella septempunctata TaxID=41139 RepID=UPI001D06C86F|nr:adenylate cyclase type 10-like isoform X2 [Coccinella septempunctata]